MMDRTMGQRRWLTNWRQINPEIRVVLQHQQWLVRHSKAALQRLLKIGLCLPTATGGLMAVICSDLRTYVPDYEVLTGYRIDRQDHVGCRPIHVPLEPD